MCPFPICCMMLARSKGACTMPLYSSTTDAAGQKPATVNSVTDMPNYPAAADATAAAAGAAAAWAGVGDIYHICVLYCPSNCPLLLTLLLCHRSARSDKLPQQQVTAASSAALLVLLPLCDQVRAHRAPTFSACSNKHKHSKRTAYGHSSLAHRP